MNYTEATDFLDYKDLSIQSMVEEFKSLSTSREKIAGLYLKIRDHWRYNPYHIGLKPEHFKASYIAQKAQGHCIDKAILYIAGLRALGIPARLRLAKVKNHIAAERLEQKLGTNEIAPHGLVDVMNEGKWVKCSPAFNKELCEMYQVAPLDFNGEYDAIFQEYNKKDHRFMEYLEDYGCFEDVPYDLIVNKFRENYPQLYKDFEGKDEMLIS